MRVFLDTNVLVSADSTRAICADLLRYILAEHELLTGEVNLVELRRVLRDRFHASPELIETVDAELRDQTIIPKPTRPSSLSIRDPDDGLILASAIEGHADLLVTEDQDLLSISSQASLPIVDPRGCWDCLRKYNCRTTRSASSRRWFLI